MVIMNILDTTPRQMYTNTVKVLDKIISTSPKDVVVSISRIAVKSYRSVSMAFVLGKMVYLTSRKNKGLKDE